MGKESVAIMTKSYMKSQLRKYQATHPWARKLPKNMISKGRNRDDMPIDLGVIDYTDPAIMRSEEEEARRVGDGSWAIVYDESRKGEWLWELADNGWADHICSECRFTVNTDIHVKLGPEYDRCPRCGADMTAEHGVRFTDTAIVVE